MTKTTRGFMSKKRALEIIDDTTRACNEITAQAFEECQRVVAETQIIIERQASSAQAELEALRSEIAAIRSTMGTPDV